MAPQPGRAEAILDRLHGLHPQLIDLSLHRLEALLARLGHPERRLPPVIHVAGTNGKGSTCAFLRAMAEAAGLRVHVYTSPHLVRFNERFRLAGHLADDAQLSATLEEIEIANAGAAITVFEVITACAFLLFARVPADLTVLEVGLGGRFDATNVIPPPLACAITAISIDHAEFLGDRLAGIAAEKAGIIKPGVPVATGAQTAEVMTVLREVAAAQGAPLLAREADWHVTTGDDGMVYEDARGRLALPAPALAGLHQVDNAGIAIATLRATVPAVGPTAIARGLMQAEWPARLQRLHGRLAAMLPEAWELWLDGGHNPGGGAVLGAHLASWQDRPVHLLVGMKKGKNSADFLQPLLPWASSLWAVVEPGQHLALPVEAIIAASGGRARPGPRIADALRALATDEPPGRVLICGSLYLAGEVIKADGN
jgi:dihydrofolate synthase/folylpolyglutamate synthase